MAKYKLEYIWLDGYTPVPNLRSKTQLKEKWMRYWEVLDELVERHRFARVLLDDDEGRGLLADEAVRLVIPSLERFVTRNRDKDFTKSMFPASFLLSSVLIHLS